MSEWSPDADDASSDESPERGDGIARVMTILPVALRLVPTSHPRAPKGHTVFRAVGTIAGMGDDPDDADDDPSVVAADTSGKSAGTPMADDDDEPPVLAQGSLPTATFEAVQHVGLFHEPVPLLLTAQEHDGGVRGVLAAIVPARLVERVEREARASEEPWLASVDAAPEPPSFDAGEDDADEAHVPFALGVILRFPEDRKHPDALDDEAVDLLATILSGQAMDADRKRVENLLKSL